MTVDTSGELCGPLGWDDPGHQPPRAVPRAPDTPAPNRMALEPAAMGPTPESPRLARSESGVLRDLGIFGFERIEPVILAALITEEPMLLIGPHGTAKSLLLTRISEALGLEFRHYNASLLNFDDLVGFPVPSPGGELEYAQTPAAIWGAEAVIFDEISRCQPHMQNKLFPLVHERKVQGLPLEKLRYRWSAMNPPDREDDEEGYIGSEPLDPALADRFVFVVPVPSWQDLSPSDQLAVIAGKSESVGKRAAGNLRQRISTGRSALEVMIQTMEGQLANYVQVLVSLLAQAGLDISPRRTRMLCRAALAVNAAASTRDTLVDVAEMTLLAAQNALPQRAGDVTVPEMKLLAAHREAWAFAKVSPEDPMRVIVSEPNPLERARLALATPKLGKGDFSTVIMDVYAELEPGAREALVAHLFESDAVGRLNTAVADPMAQAYAKLIEPPHFERWPRQGSVGERLWASVKDALSRLAPEDEFAACPANMLVRCYLAGQFTSSEQVGQALGAWDAAHRRFSGGAE